MCGICGYIAAETGEPIEAHHIQAMTKALSHRGPDAEGCWIDGPVGLGHRRLSIIDLSEAARQPMTARGLTTHIVFNGEIYNFKEIRDELSRKGRLFTTHSDTEVILYAYDEWGQSCVSRFNGMYAFAIYDSNRRTLFAARDRLGVKPFYYYWDGRNFIFASEIKSLLLHPSFQRVIDRDAVQLYFAFKYIRAPRTIFKNTFKLNPGHTLTLHGRELSTAEYWHPSQFAVVEPARTESEYEEEFEELFSSAVRYRLISDVPLGVLLSGGVDSSLVTSFMTETASRVRSFCIGFSEKRYDESRFARAVAKHLGTDHVELTVTPDDVFDSIETLAYSFDEPFADPSSLPTFLVAKHARQDVAVVLSGDAGDELFWGYSRYRKFRYAERFGAIPASVRSTISKIFGTLPVDVLQKSLRGVAFKTWQQLYDYLSGIFKGEDLARLIPGHRGPLPTLFGPDTRFPPFVSSELALSLVDLQSFLPDDILTKVDRTSMAVSLEARSPFLDYRVVEFAMRLPFDLKYRNGVQKFLLKKSLFKRVPKALFDRPKQGFDLPLNEWFRGPLNTLITDHLQPARVKRFGFIDERYVTSLLQKHLSGRYDYYYMLWALLCFDLWYERYMEQ